MTLKDIICIFIFFSCLGLAIRLWNQGAQERKLEAELLAFFDSWYDWALKDAPSHPTHRKGEGLCSNWQDWLENRMEVTPQVRWRSIQLLNDLFEKAGMDKNFPFHDGCGVDFFAERDKHRNVRRRAFVRAQLGRR